MSPGICARTGVWSPGLAGFPQHAWQHGRVIAFADAQVGLGDRGLLFGESLYEVLALTCNKPRLVQAHAERMRRGAAALGLADTLLDAGLWTRIADALIEAERLRDGLLYLQLTGGAGPRAHLGEATPELFAYAMPHVFPDHARVSQGVRAVTAEDPRWGRCDLKTTMLLPAVLGKRRARERGADEMLWIGADGHVHEGASSNLGIVERGAVIVPPAGPQLLPGITMAELAVLAPRIGIAWRMETIDRERLARADEVFIAATSQLAMPVLAIDDVPVADGKAGPIATRLAALLRAQLELE
jgi:D-alanine transaminase